MEHHLCELADLRLPHLVVHAVDGAGSAQVCHDHLALHGVLREPAHRAAVHLELRGAGRRARALPEEGGAFQGTGLQGTTDSYSKGPNIHQSCLLHSVLSVFLDVVLLQYNNITLLCRLKK